METLWLTIGFIGQGLFGLRFLVQWLASEKEKRSVIPHSFWYISLPAAVLLVAYAAWRRDPVFFVNESICLLVFIRNVFLLKGKGAEG